MIRYIHTVRSAANGRQMSQNHINALRKNRLAAALGRQQEVDGPAAAVDGTMQIHPSGL